MTRMLRDGKARFRTETSRRGHPPEGRQQAATRPPPHRTGGRGENRRRSPSPRLSCGPEPPREGAAEGGETMPDRIPVPCPAVPADRSAALRGGGLALAALALLGLGPALAQPGPIQPAPGAAPEAARCAALAGMRLDDTNLLSATTVPAAGAMTAKGRSRRHRASPAPIREGPGMPPLGAPPWEPPLGAAPGKGSAFPPIRQDPGHCVPWPRRVGASCDRGRRQRGRGVFGAPPIHWPGLGRKAGLAVPGQRKAGSGEVEALLRQLPGGGGSGAGGASPGGCHEAWRPGHQTARAARSGWISRSTRLATTATARFSARARMPT